MKVLLIWRRRTIGLIGKILDDIKNGNYIPPCVTVKRDESDGLRTDRDVR